MALLCGLGILLLKHLYEVRGLSVETLDCDPKAGLDKKIYIATVPVGQRLQFPLHRWRAIHGQLSLRVHGDRLGVPKTPFPRLPQLIEST
jgi:hypothetical protein